MTYIRFSNGSTTRLIDMNNIPAQETAEEDGFEMVIGEDGVAVTVDSSEIINQRVTDRRTAMIRAINEKINGNKNNVSVNKNIVKDTSKKKK